MKDQIVPNVLVFESCGSMLPIVQDYALRAPRSSSGGAFKEFISFHKDRTAYNEAITPLREEEIKVIPGLLVTSLYLCLYYFGAPETATTFSSGLRFLQDWCTSFLLCFRYFHIEIMARSDFRAFNVVLTTIFFELVSVLISQCKMNSPWAGLFVGKIRL